ncbi:putative Aspartate--ammonia ligase protein, partial [Pseudoloma neurophilia]
NFMNFHIFTPRQMIFSDQKKMDTYLDTQKTIGTISEEFSRTLGENLNLTKVRAPIYLEDVSLSDTLDGKQRLIEIDFKGGKKGYILHSLAKWKRYILYKYNFCDHTGILTDMMAIRRDEDIDKLHSYFVDQWDWEMAIKKEDRTIDFLKKTVNKIYDAFLTVDKKLYEKHKINRKL